MVQLHGKQVMAWYATKTESLFFLAVVASIRSLWDLAMCPTKIKHERFPVQIVPRCGEDLRPTQIQHERTKGQQLLKAGAPLFFLCTPHSMETATIVETGVPSLHTPWRQKRSWRQEFLDAYNDGD